MEGFLVKSVISVACILLGFPGDLTAANPYCFQLTWMGPSFKNETFALLNSTSCTSTYDYCTNPMVVTPDGSSPDFVKLWNKYESSPQQIACPLTTGHVCAKWISYYDDTVEYTTHTCSKITVVGEGSMTSGCVTSVTNNSRTVEVCACRSYDDSQPCNSGHHPYTSVTVCGLLIVFFLVLKCVT